MINLIIGTLTVALTIAYANARISRWMDNLRNQHVERRTFDQVEACKLDFGGERHD